MKPQVEEEWLPNPPEPGLQTEASSNRRLWCPQHAEVASLRPGAVPAVLSGYFQSAQPLLDSQGVSRLCSQQVPPRKDNEGVLGGLGPGSWVSTAAPAPRRTQGYGILTSQLCNFPWTGHQKPDCKPDPSTLGARLAFTPVILCPSFSIIVYL